MASPLRGRLMVGRLTLDQVVKVRVLAPQPQKTPAHARVFRPSAGLTETQSPISQAWSISVVVSPRTDVSRWQRANIARVELHKLGPRVYVLGRRVHECQVGIALMLGVSLALFSGRLPVAHWSLGLLAVGAWLVVKDWRDLFASSRDTARWRLGVHRTSRALQHVRRGERLPVLAAACTSSLGLINMV